MRQLRALTAMALFFSQICTNVVAKDTPVCSQDFFQWGTDPVHNHYNYYPYSPLLQYESVRANHYKIQGVDMWDNPQAVLYTVGSAVDSEDLGRKKWTVTALDVNNNGDTYPVFHGAQSSPGGAVLSFKDLLGSNSKEISIARGVHDSLSDEGVITVGSTRYNEFTPTKGAIAVYLKNGSLDPAFAGGAGKLMLSEDSVFYDVVGKILKQGAPARYYIAGERSNNGHPDFTVYAYLPNGNLDTSWGNQGRVQLTLGPIGSFATKIIAIPDGSTGNFKLLVAGGYLTNPTTLKLAYALISEDGVVEKSLRSTIPLVFDSDDSERGLPNTILDSPGKGRIYITAYQRIVKINRTTLRPDTSFGGGAGYSGVAGGGGLHELSVLESTKHHSAAKLISSGTAFNPVTERTEVAYFRLNDDDGSLDNTWGDMVDPDHPDCPNNCPRKGVAIASFGADVKFSPPAMVWAPLEVEGNPYGVPPEGVEQGHLISSAAELNSVFGSHTAKTYCYEACLYDCETP